MQELLLCAASFNVKRLALDMMTRDARHRMKSLSPEVRRQIGSEPMRRFVRSLPAFSVKPDVPEHLQDLLDRLDHAEKKAKAHNDHRLNGRS
jgi:hypothetical protein